MRQPKPTFDVGAYRNGVLCVEFIRVGETLAGAISHVVGGRCLGFCGVAVRASRKAVILTPVFFHFRK
jgi:hypothetical protein